MKKNLLIIAAIASATLVSCSSEEFSGEDIITPGNESKAIAFSSQTGAITRADLYGEAAAAKLGNKFVVYGTKHTAAEDATADNDKVVYNNFQVAWKDGTAQTTPSNSSDWEYIGLQAYDATPTQQGIKYWDYSTEGYTFYAFSSQDISYPADATNDKVSVTKVTSDASSLYNKGYAVTVKPGATLNNLYFSNRVPVAKADYDKTVNFTFRNIGAKVRVGFYETIPGYTVKIDKFYIDEDASDEVVPATAPVTTFAAMKDSKTDGFYASLQNVKSSVAQTLNVTYYDDTNPIIENRPKMTNPTAGYNYYLKLGNGTGIIDKTLKTSSADPTWVAGKAAENYYIPVFPFEDNTNPLLLKLDFTMTADDGSGDVIKVRGARAIVPAEYVQWKSNFAYTYLFKISDMTNGTTGKVDANGDPIEDPEGLKPITFDAIVVDVTEELQETITSVSTNSITTYAEGAIADEYNAGEPIYVAISTTADPDPNANPNNGPHHAVIEPTAIGDEATEAQVYKLSKAVTEADIFAKLTGSPIEGLTLTAVDDATIEATVPLVDGTNADIANVKFTPDAAGTYYAYVYTKAKYVAPRYSNQADKEYISSRTYYMKSSNGVYYVVSVPNKAAFDENKANLYYKTHSGTKGDYDIKVIKTQAQP